LRPQLSNKENVDDGLREMEMELENIYGAWIVKE
jgi:hypothetical protein